VPAAALWALVLPHGQHRFCLEVKDMAKLKFIIPAVLLLAAAAAAIFTAERRK